MSHMHRTLMRIEQVGDRAAIVTLTGRKPQQPLIISNSLLPVYYPVEPGAHFFVYANTGADRTEDLRLEDFELAPEPDPDDGLAPANPHIGDDALAFVDSLVPDVVSVELDGEVWRRLEDYLMGRILQADTDAGDLLVLLSDTSEFKFELE